MDEEKHTKKELLDDLIGTFYDGSFSRMVCDYIRNIEMENEKVDALLEAIKKEVYKGDMKIHNI